MSALEDAEKVGDARAVKKGGLGIELVGIPKTSTIDIQETMRLRKNGLQRGRSKCFRFQRHDGPHAINGHVLDWVAAQTECVKDAMDELGVYHVCKKMRPTLHYINL